MRYTNDKKYVDQKHYHDAMSRDDQKDWLAAFWKQMHGLIKLTIFQVFEPPADANMLGTTMPNG